MFHTLSDIEEKSVSLSYTCTAAAMKLPFYLQFCGHYCCKANYYAERTGLKSYLLLYTLSGLGYLKTAQYEAELPPGSIALIDCNKYQYYRTLGDTWVFEWMHFHGTAAARFFSIISEGLRAPIISDTESLRFYDRFSELAALPDTVTDIRINSQITSLLSAVICAKQNRLYSERLYRYRESLEKAVNFMRLHYSGEIGVSELAAAANMSKFHFERNFKAYYGKTPYEYLTAVRIDSAKQLLKGTPRSIGEIAALTGFTDASSFIRRFKGITGITPLKYRLFIIE
ncbi:MAG: AraC family transcriptional regulator [Clostridia bacterium]|nr:AraC family transcriptional regulator [Clostridia bacterium]MDR3644553.1 AraC family transcriptional regulator [Clostridia bacterium]